MWVCSFSPPTAFSFLLSHTVHHAQPQFTSHSLVTRHLHSLRCSIRRLLASLGIQSPATSSIVRGLLLAFTLRLTCIYCSMTSEASLSLPRCISSRPQLFVGLLCGSTGLRFRTSKSSTNGTKNHRVLLREPHPPVFTLAAPLGVSRASFLPGLTAICVSIDRIPQDTAPTRCLPFDRIGVRHPGIPASASPHVDLQQTRNLISSFAFRSEVSLVSHDSRGGYVLGFCGWHDSGNVLRIGTWHRHRASCRDAELQFHQKINNKLGPYSVGYGLSKRKQL